MLGWKPPRSAELGRKGCMSEMGLWKPMANGLLGFESSIAHWGYLSSVHSACKLATKSIGVLQAVLGTRPNNGKLHMFRRLDT